MCSSTHSQSAGDPPTLHELLHFPVKDGFKDVMVEIQNDYVKLGIQLLQDDNGNIVEGIEKMKHGDPGDITVEILRQWLQGKGRKPVTWQTLVECLEATKLHVAANYIKVALNRNNSASFMGQQTASCKWSFPDFSKHIFICNALYSCYKHKYHNTCN